MRGPGAWAARLPAEAGPGRRAARRPAAALSALLAVASAALAGCASIPTSGEVRYGEGGVLDEGEIVNLPYGPREGADPHDVVEGFLTAAQAGPNNPQQFTTAKEFLFGDQAAAWDPTATVAVYEGDILVEADAVDENATVATVHATVSVAATLDAHGFYTEEAVPVPVETEFGLVREAGGQWRINALDDGMFILDALFATSFRETRLYFPTTDHRFWVPDQRWFPRNGWRTEAVREVLAGPPAWLQGAAVGTVPDGTALDVSAVPVNEETGRAEVRLTAPFAQMENADRALFAAQLSATLADGRSTQPVTLYADSVEQPVSDVPAPSAVRTEGEPLVLLDGVLHTVTDRRLEPFEREVTWDGVVDPTALAAGPAATPIVVRDGTSRIVRLTDGGGVVATGANLVAPSVDRFGTVWTSGEPGTLQAVDPDGTVRVVTADWLSGRAVTGLRVSPEGARVAIVSVGPTGPQVDVAGVVRGTDGVPALGGPVRVARTVSDAREVQWSGSTSLLVLTWDVTGRSAIWSVGVGGLSTSTGRSRELSGVTGPQQLAAGVNDLGIYAINEAGTLVVRQVSGQWARIQDGVRLVAFQG